MNKKKKQKQEVIALPNGLTFSEIDCVYNVLIVSKEFEKKAKKILDITKNMELDLNDEEFIKVITSNYEEGRYYTYVLPENQMSKKYEENYKNLYSNYKRKFNFIFIPEHIFDLLQEIVIYNAPESIDDNTKLDGFMLLTTANESKLYIKLSYHLLKEYLKTIYSYKDIEKMPALKKFILKYLGNSAIKENAKINSMLLEFNRNPLALFDGAEFIEVLEKANLNTQLISEIKQDYSNLLVELGNKNE